MLTKEDLQFWLGAGNLSAFGPVFEATAAMLQRPVTARLSGALAHLRAARTAREVAGDPASQTFLFLAMLLRYSVRHLAGAIRVNLAEPVDGYTTVYVLDGEDGILRIYDNHGLRIRSLTLTQQGVIQLAAERARGIEPQRGPPPRAWGKDVRHSRNTAGTMRAMRGRPYR